MKPETFSWPPPREIRNVSSGRRMAELRSTVERRGWSADNSQPPTATARIEYLSDSARQSVLDALIAARDLGKPATKKQIQRHCRLSEVTVRKALADLMKRGLIAQAGQSELLANYKRAVTYRAKHIGEDAPLLTEQSPVRDRLRPHLVVAARTGRGITRKELAAAAEVAWSVVGNTLLRMKQLGEVREIGRLPQREGGAMKGRLPILYAATEKL